MNTRFVTFVLLLFVWLEGNSVWAQYLPKLYQVFSPDKKLVMAIQRHNDGLLTYTFAANREVLIKESSLGFKLESQETVPSSGWKIENVSDRQVRNEWRPLWGKRAVVKDHFNELVIDLLNPAGQPERMQLVVRGYNDGFAFCYKIPEGEGECVNVQSELTAYNFAGDYTAWFYNGENHNIGPEKLTETDGTRLPVMTVKAGDRHYMAIHEACLETGAPLVLQSKGGESLFSVASKPADLSPGYTSAWRVVLYGTTPGVLTDSHLLELLNPDPDSRYDFSWVKPGLAVWDWRINGAVWDGFTYGMSYPSWVRMVDFAAEQGFKYLVLDANWYGPEFESDSDPVKGEKAQDVQRLLKYGKEKGVGIWLYLNDVGGRKYPIEKTLKQYGDWGAAGVKYGFMSGTQEEKNRWTKKITELCAQNRLLVDFHDGPVHPYGQMRTWPNAVTREYCHAQLDGHHVFEPKTFVTTVFVNMVAGPVDMNNGMFDLRQGHTTRVDESQPVPSTLVSEAARTLITFSGVTILPDIPEYYRKYPALLNFLSAQKMPWRESRTLAGEIGEYIVMMRETDDAYLVGAATNESGRMIDLPLSFLEKGKYTVEVIEDGDDAHYLTNRESLKTTTRQLTNNDKLTLKLAPGGGACLVIKKTPSMRVREQATFPLVSPSEKMNADIKVGGKNVEIDLFDNGEKVVTAKTLQFSLDENTLKGNWTVTNQKRKSVDQTWQPVYGERSVVTDRYNEVELTLQSDENRKEMVLSVRLYDEGLAFRYAFDKLDFWNRTVTDEKTQFLFQEDCKTWVTGMAQGAYSETKLSGLKGAADRPQVIQVDDNRFVAIGEAALVDYSRMKLEKSEAGFGVQSVLSGKVNLDLAGYRSPWRYVMVAGHPGKLVENNYFVLNLNEPNQIANTNWIKPGQVIREVTLTTTGSMACIDFAAENNIAYVLFDAGWYGAEEDVKSDATTVTVDPTRSKGPLDLPKVIEYANSKGVGILVYVNKKALHQQLDEILPLYKKWGIKGVKYGFVNVGDQYATAWLHQAVRKAAKYELMVDIHDEYRPTGYSRTYPNLLTQEGIRGDEESPSLDQTIYTLYNRMICGAGDYTNCYFAERVTKKMGGRAAQLAKLVAIYSPWQFVYWYDRPEKSPRRASGAGSVESVIKTDAATRFYNSIPTVWDETRFLEGEMGKYAVVARRSGSDWYVSMLNAGDKKQISLPLDFLKNKKNYTCLLYTSPSPRDSTSSRMPSSA